MLLAAVAAMFAGTAVALQQHASAHEDRHAVMDPRLIFHLLRRRRWLLGQLIGIVGFAFQAAAIGTGHLVLVEPILVAHILTGLVVSARLWGRRLGRREWLGIAATVVGVGGFLITAAPTAGHDPTPEVPWFVPLAILAALVIIGRVVTSRLDEIPRAVTLGALTGLGFGTADALIKVISDLGTSGGLFTHWPLYTWMVVSTTTFIVQQSAYHSGHLGAALPAIASVQPVTAALLGVLMLDEKVRSGWAIPVEVVFAGVILLGATLLARSPVHDLDGAEPMLLTPP
jgi:drug/metabolite transporter (DMT)-like permease